jgi:hypothetical protein
MVPACFARAGAQLGRLLGAFWEKERSCEPRILLTSQVIPGVQHVNYNLQFIPISGPHFLVRLYESRGDIDHPNTRKLRIISMIYINNQSFEIAFEEAMMSQWSEHVLQLQSS